MRARRAPLIYSHTVRQAATLVELLDGVEFLRRGDRCLARFRFVHHAEYLTKSMPILFREGPTTGVGRITKVCGE